MQIGLNVEAHRGRQVVLSVYYIPTFATILSLTIPMGFFCTFYPHRNEHQRKESMILYLIDPFSRVTAREANPEPPRPQAPGAWTGFGYPISGRVPCYARPVNL